MLNLAVMLLTCIREISDLESAWFSSVHPGESQNSTLKQTTNDLFQILSST